MFICLFLDNQNKIAGIVNRLIFVLFKSTHSERVHFTFVQITPFSSSQVSFCKSGKQYGLTVTPTVDERCHVAKATEAACKYLKAAYDKYGDWANVAASYNAGMGRISGELTKQEADSTFDLWLVEETSRYVYRIMAIKQIFENPYKYGFVLRAEDLYKPVACEDVAVSSDIPDLSAFAQKYDITYADLKRFNPWLRDRKLQTLGKTYTLQIPKQSDMYYKTPNAYVHNPAWVVR